MIQMVEKFDSATLQRTWAMYQAAFADLNTLAVQRHLMYEDEFAAVAGDKRVLKYLHHDDDGQVQGLATYTNNLDAVPLISPPYFARRWPEHYEQQRIWYVGFVAVRDGAPLTVFGELLAAMHTTSGRTAITVLDVCTHSEQARHLPRSVRVLLHRLDGPVRCDRLDEQSYWAYEFTDGGGAQP